MLIRDYTRINGRYKIVNKYCNALKTYYNVLYRTRKEYIKMFKRTGYILI